MYRRSFLRLGASVLAAPMINLGSFQLFADSSKKYSARAIDLVEGSLVIDMLGLLTLDWPKLAKWESKPDTFSSHDFQKMKESGISVFNPAVALNSKDPYAGVLKWISDLNFLISERSECFQRIEAANDFEIPKKEGRVGVLVGMQNADHFRTVEDVRFFFNQGQRVSQLTYNLRNQIGYGCLEPQDRGLTDYGVSVVEEMNRIGMAIDVAHAGARTALNAFEASKKPVLITHSNCSALVPRHPRCVPDDVIKKMGQVGGVMGITAIQDFVCKNGRATIENVLDHFDHVVKLAGVEHVGVGSDDDLEGRDRFLSRIARRIDVPGLNHPRRMYDLTEGLIRRKYTNDNIELILGGNFRRALDAIWAA